MTASDEFCPSRRSLLRSLAALPGLVLAPGVLVACGADEPGAAPSSESASSAGVPASDVPVGQARVVDSDGQRIVVAQPTEGEFVAFSAKCTHEGTPVAAGEGLVLTCPNHGSQFDATDGSATRGPATTALASVDVTVDGDRLVFA